MPARSEPAANDDAFPTRHVADVPLQPPEAQWLVERLWAACGVGIVGGQPKCLKTWLATELALAVASGGQALGRFCAKQQGPVLFFAAEDTAPAMRARFEATASARGIRLADVPVLLLDLAELRLNDQKHLDRLRRTVATVQARLLVLDPFVRVARLDENSAQEVSAVLGALRTIQRDLQVAVLVVHHMRKSPSAHLGQQLRGSGDFAAWSDSGLYLVRRGEDMVLSVEHRGAPAPPPLRLRLSLDGAPHLVIDDEEPPQTPSSPPLHPPSTDIEPLEADLIDRLRLARRPQTTVQLRAALHVRKVTLLESLRRLQQRGLLARDHAGWSLVPGSPVPDL
jgi:hypothetical protein